VVGFKPDGRTNIYVTVGSGGFDQLIDAADKQLSSDFQLWCQIGKGKTIPSANHFRFNEQFKHYIAQADMIVTHGGAGTVFELLELGKKLVVVPNLYRVDSHQKDLARYLEQERFAVVCWDLSQLYDCVARCLDNKVFNAKPYQKQPFFMADELLSYFSLKNQVLSKD